MKSQPVLSRGLALALPLMLGGCLTGTNVHGDFACRAPGGTCAPMTSIDAQAIASMGTASPGQSIDAMPTVSSPGGIYRPRDLGSNPARTADRAFKIVFPAHIDGSGIYHDEASAHVVVERGEWTDGLTGGSRSAAIVVTATSSGPVLSVAPGTGAAPGSVLASLDDVVASRSAKRADANAEPGAAATEGRGASPPASQSVPSAPSTSAILPSNYVRPSAWTSPPMTPSAPSWGPSASPQAQSLREAVAGSDGGKINKLDGSYDTPDVRAAATSSDPVAMSPATAVVAAMTRKVRWHGRLYEVPVKHPTTASPTQVASASDLAPASAPAASVALNQASLARSNPAATKAADPTPVTAAVQTGAILAPVIPAYAKPYPLTADAKVAAARVRTMAAPVIEGRVAADLAAVASEPALGAMLSGMAGLSSTANTFSAAAGAVLPNSEPRP